MVGLSLGHEPDAALAVRAAWLYHMAGLTQEEVAGRLGIHRSRVVRLLADARERGLISVTIHHEQIRDLEIEDALARRFGLDFCLATPRMGLDPGLAEPRLIAAQGMIARRAVGSVAASFLAGKLVAGTAITVGVSWGRTLEQTAAHLTGVTNPRARFVSVMGSLTRNSASNPFEVVQALAARTGGEGHFLPVPFIADSVADRAVLLAQRSVAAPLAMAHAADLYLISVGELRETSFLRRQDMMTASELAEVRERGAVADSLGRLFGADGGQVDHPLSHRTLAVSFEQLRGRAVVLVAGGPEKADAIVALLASGVVRGLIVDGDTAALIAAMEGPP